MFQDGNLLYAFESKVRHAQCFDSVVFNGYVAVACKDFKIYLYKFDDDLKLLQHQLTNPEVPQLEIPDDQPSPLHLDLHMPKMSLEKSIPNDPPMNSQDDLAADEPLPERTNAQEFLYGFLINDLVIFVPSPSTSSVHLFN